MMKKTFLLSILFIITATFSFAQTLTITTTVCDGADEVRLTGPWWGWSVSGGPVAVDNGDGTWSFTLENMTEDMEYLLVVDGFMENLVSAGDFSCTPVTDNSSYANRKWTAGSGDVTNTYGTCTSCAGLVVYGCMDDEAVNYNENATEDDGNCAFGVSFPLDFESGSYDLLGFDGGSIEIVDNPFSTSENSSAKVIKYVRNVGATWAGCIVTTNPIDFSIDSVIKMKVYSPNANIPVLLKLEGQAGENTELTENTTVANQWEELTFNFGDEQPSDLFSKVVIIFNNGIMGDGSANSTYYFDDIRFASQEITVTETEKVDVTFQVDMSAVETHAEGVYLAGGGFGQDGHLLTDNGSDVWSITLELDANQTYLYKFRNQPSYETWDGFEDMAGLVAGGCSTGDYNDRFVEVAEADIVLDVVSYGSCTGEVTGVVGCLDANATNYDEAATIQSQDQWGNILCVYASCADIPEVGCIYAESFGAFNEAFDAAACTTYGGTPCETIGLFETEMNAASIYPNPSADFIRISNTDAENITVFNINGQQVLSVNDSDKEINVSHLSSGIYTLRITSRKGDFTYSKLIKE